MQEFKGTRSRFVLVYGASPSLSPGGSWGRGEGWVRKEGLAHVISMHDS